MNEGINPDWCSVVEDAARITTCLNRAPQLVKVDIKSVYSTNPSIVPTIIGDVVGE